jgi:hypothetical protein
MSLSIATVMPSQDEKTAQERIRTLLLAANETGVQLDPQGYTLSWMSDNSRSFIGVDEDKKVVAFAHIVFGRPYHDSTFSSTVMMLGAKDLGIRTQVLGYLRDVSKMLGASVMLFEGQEGDTFPSEPMPLRAHKIE